MRKIFLISLLFAGLFQLKGQESKLSFFEPLMGKTWSAEGNWGDGSKFKQDITFRFGLNDQVVIAESNGYTNQEQTTYGPRNHGVRKFDTATNSVKFWEFDVFGGLTEGTVTVNGKDIIYTYRYGESVVTDYWEYVDENTYNYTVGDYENGTWNQKYLTTKFIAHVATKPE